VKAKGNEEVLNFLAILEMLHEMDHDELARMSERTKELAEKTRR